ncbi:hypothetical protein SAMN06295879_3378 [Agreia bicolorata]|uniref:Uncharacterized protein n=1 Tax=Agreia bicolorata TaxID=110935 RepID=A0A1T4YJM5_9MICO|nr:hypothetical protein [Agreia bicolorata]SKB01890.1 hypothetical protein SAMN06295879_3378 [Agreia bicolorata]
MTIITALLGLLGIGVAASSIALAFDIRTHSPHADAPHAKRPGRAVLYSMTVVACCALVAALALSALMPRSEIDATPLARVAATLLTLAFATIGGGPFAVLALRLATRGTSRTGVHGGILITTNGQPSAELPSPETPARSGIFRRRLLANRRVDPKPASSPLPEQALGTSTVEVLRGGTTIGVLERLAIAGAVIAGFPEAIAVVIAIKGVGRFSELAASEAKERFIIGTLASFVWACACALVLR